MFIPKCNKNKRYDYISHICFLLPPPLHLFTMFSCPIQAFEIRNSHLALPVLLLGTKIINDLKYVKFPYIFVIFP